MRHSPFESLEMRRLFAAVYPTNEDQLMIELMNRARANPTAEAQREGISLTEGLRNGENITTTPKQPLAFNLLLDDAAKAQADWNLHNTTLATFGHSGPGGNQPIDRMNAAGYTVGPNDLGFENAAINLFTSVGILGSQMEQQYDAYFKDTANADGGRGHRLHIMADAFKEVGSGYALGNYNYTDPNTHVTTTYQGFVTVIDFGTHDNRAYLTGVAYSDNQIQDNFYTPNEGLAGVTVAAVRQSDGKTFLTQTFSSGGYTLPVSPGTYDIYGFGAGLGGYVHYGNVSIGTLNVKKDFTPPMVSPDSVPFTLQVGHTLYINGTSGADQIGLARSGDTYMVTRVGSSPHSTMSFDATKITSIQVDLGDGNDEFSADPGVQAVYVNGGLGDDLISGGGGNDTLTGAAGADIINGNGGDDRINGGTRSDLLYGGEGADRIYGDDGNDKLYGLAGVDRLFGGAGNDFLSGGSSNDKIYGEAGNDVIDGDNQNDLLNGGDGNDSITGGNGNDQLVGGAGNDQLFGNKGNDIFDSLDNAIDTLDGGAGSNTGTMDAVDIRTAVK